MSEEPYRAPTPDESADSQSRAAFRRTVYYWFTGTMLPLSLIVGWSFGFESRVGVGAGVVFGSVVGFLLVDSVRMLFRWLLKALRGSPDKNT